MIEFLILIIILILWAMAGDNHDALKRPQVPDNVTNTVNNLYRNCTVHDNYDGDYEVNNTQRIDLFELRGNKNGR